MSDNTYAIFQLNNRAEMRYFRFEPLDRLKTAGLSVERGNYDHVYTGTLKQPNEPVTNTLNRLYEQFNTGRPADFRGRSMSISDVVVLRGHEGRIAAYYIDSGNRFTETAEFLNGPYKYYSTQRPVDIGTFPKFANEPIRIENFDSRIAVDGGVYRAWGALIYTMPLTQKQMDGYELKAAPGNPDFTRQAPPQLEAQLEVIGKWELSRRIPDVRRMTWFYSDYGVFVKNERYTHEQVADAYQNVLDAKARAVEKRAAPKCIAEQLAEAKKQVERGASAPAKKHSKSHEDR